MIENKVSPFWDARRLTILTKAQQAVENGVIGVIKIPEIDSMEITEGD